jgi:hypothetical protein
MTQDKEKRTLIYKRTHSGDPNPETGILGNNKCMGRVRGWPFEAVIGIGGIGRKPQQERIARKLTWVGIDPKEAGMGEDGYPRLRFAHFLYYGDYGPLLEEELAPNLARRMYGRNVRLIFDSSLSEEERLEVEKILDLARNEPPSGQLEGTSHRSSQRISSKCRSNSCRGRSAAR